MKKYYGNHIGIVIQNNDPDKAGKVKIFIPHISSTIYNNWVRDSKNKTLKFKQAKPLIDGGEWVMVSAK